MEPTVMEIMLTGVGEVSVFLFGLVGDVVGLIVANPLMLMFFSVAVVASGVGLFQRLRG